ncbi:DUF4260 domain-containing protein [Amphibacillus cookii]|uniref:DUF4260 domain-containing protein n=1 Tax=Amphibacillus cookii TaxID=767787 RepID=UPI00195AA4AB|nr:DUF4260 domain-containing protein [Amphibacillus cookii]MBM7542605.1 putative membrane protein YwzB [Amphibacillus cookii]
MAKLLLHFEGLVVVFISLYFYHLNGFSWWLLILLALAPDLSMLAYLISVRIGAVVYNFFHTYIIPVLLILLAIFIDSAPLLAVCLIWVTHIGVDRLCGYGLKYPTTFKDTHLNRI